MDSPSQFLQLLLSISIQAGILAILILGVKALFGRYLTPRWQYALWILVFLRLLIPLVPETRYSPANFLGNYSSAITNQNSGKSFTGFFTQKEARPDLSPGDMALSTSPHKTVSAEKKTWLRADVLLLMAWGCGVVILLIMLTQNALALNALIRRARAVEDEQLVLDFQRSCDDLCILKHVKLVVSDEVSAPALAGLLSPVVILPADLPARASRAELEFIISHELIHFKRRDLLSGCVAAILLCIHWFNPLIWIAFKKMRADGELAVDAAVIQHLGKARAADYGRTILMLAEGARSKSSQIVSVGIMEIKSEAGRRIATITRRQEHGRFQSVTSIAVAVVLVVCGFTRAETNTPATKMPVQPVNRPTDQTAPTTSTLEIAGQQPPAKTEKLKQFPFTLTVAENVGELVYKFDEKTQALETIEGKNEVRFETSGTVISADELTFMATINELTSTGSVSAEIPHFPNFPFESQEKQKVVVTADSLTYQIAENMMDFKGNVIMRQANSSGHVTETVGERIQLTFGDNGKLQLRVTPSGRIESDTRPE